MSTDLIMMRPPDRQALVPATAWDMKLFCETAAPGKDLHAKLTQPRLLPQHRFHWGLLQKVVETHSFYLRQMRSTSGSS